MKILKTKFGLSLGLIGLSAMLITAGCGNSVGEEKVIEEQTLTKHHHEKVERASEYTIYEAYSLVDEEQKLPDGNYLLPYEEVDGVKEFRLTAMPVEWQTTDGKTYEAWTYNGVVPGPQIRVTEGDQVRIIVENKLPEGTTVHWHGVHVPIEMDGVHGISQDEIFPGDQFVYEFEAKPAGTRLYHSHFNALFQEGRGLYGSFIIDPKDEEPTYDKDKTILLGDGYLGYIINGKEFPHIEPWELKVGETMRVRIGNLGHQIHPMHLHGHSFKVVAKDGYEIPEAAVMTQNNLEIMPGSTYDIEITGESVGDWLFHCHVLSHVDDGHGNHVGMIQVISVTE